jgi:membrane-associated phospholipid phosphatase
MRRLAATLDKATFALRDCTDIGPIGVFARIVVGLTFIYLALFWNDPSLADPLFGLVVMPHVVTGLLALRARHVKHPLRATGPLGHAANAAVFVPLFAHPATVGGALLFYGGSMLVAAARRSGGCEVTAISNAVLERDDQVGCVLFAPIDFAEARSITR